MQFKVYTDDKCPVCGRPESAERIKRNRLIRLVFPKAKRMKCRLCLTTFMVDSPKP